MSFHSSTVGSRVAIRFAESHVVIPNATNPVSVLFFLALTPYLRVSVIVSHAKYFSHFHPPPPQSFKNFHVCRCTRGILQHSLSHHYHLDTCMRISRNIILSGSHASTTYPVIPHISTLPPPTNDLVCENLSRSCCCCILGINRSGLNHTQ